MALLGLGCVEFVREVVWVRRPLVLELWAPRAFCEGGWSRKRGGEGLVFGFYV